MTDGEVFRSTDREPDVFTLDEVAARLKVHRDTVRAEIRRGALRCVKVGSRTRVTETQVQAYLHRNDDELAPRRGKRRAS
jgi:excisionase family DNA binding protein